MEVQIPLWEWASLRERGAHCKVQGLTAVSCAKTAEPIDWVVDTSGPKEAQVQSYSPDGTNVPSRRAHWRNLANTIEQFVCGGDAALCQLL